ncbi:MAG: DUF2442 domain-containing protein [Acidimicrobiia bacterium]|nr:DUF2442 domain-containing protein [Acidimicrobiia bacterium]
MAEVTDVKIVAERTVELTFADGSIRVVDLEPYLWGPVFAAIAKDDGLFAQVTVDPELGTITWPNGVDLDPAALHGDYEATQPWKQPHH